MNNVLLIINKYIENNKKNKLYYITIFFTKLFSLLIILGILFINYYYNTILNGNTINRVYEVNVGSTTQDEVIDIFERSKYIVKYYEKNKKYDINNKIINTSYEVEIENIKYNELFLSEMNSHNFEVIISNENLKSQSSTKILFFFMIISVLLYLMLLVIYIYICYIFFKKEKNNLNILRYIGFSCKDILYIINRFAKNFIKKGAIIQLLFIFILCIIWNITRIFFINNIFYILIIIILNQFIFIIVLSILEKILVRKI